MKMTLKCLMVALAFATGAGAAPFSMDEDFSVRDERGLTPAIEIEKRSSLSHLHGEVTDEGGFGYRVLVPGNRHYLAMPPVGDFTLRVDYDLHLYFNEFGLGYDVFFAGGHTLRVYFDHDGTLGFFLDGRKFADGAKTLEKDVQEYPSTLTMEMKGKTLTVGAYGTTASVEVPDAKPGKIGFDMPYSSGNQLTLRHVVLESQDAPAKTPLTDYTFVLGRSQGFSNNAVYDVKLLRYATGETELQLLLHGLLGDATNRIETGGGEWGSLGDRIDTPYLRIERTDGSEFANLPLWNGIRMLKDPELKRRAMKANANSGEALMKMEEWPIAKTFVFTHFPADWTLAAGYVYGVEGPNRLAGNGPYEQMRDKAGKFLYEGPSLRRGCVAVKILPKPDPKFLARIPADLPRRDEAIAHASTQGYFLESTVPSFTVEVRTNPREYAPSEVSYRTETQDCYGNPVASDAKLPVGVYRYVVNWTAGVRTGKEEFVFEVLPDDPDGICPPLASKLPTFYAMPNEVKFLEETVFDPWAQFGGAQHYYSVSTHYPAVGLAYHVWDALKPYGRKWFAQNEGRNTNVTDPWCEQNRFINSVAGYTYSAEVDRFDFTNQGSYRGAQLKLLADYYAARKPAAKLLTSECLAEHVKANKGLSNEEFTEFFESCWEDFVDWARPRADAMDRAFEEKLVAHNPKIARAGYGPMAIYTANYKTPYWLRSASKGMDTHPVLKANGSYWVFEEYHHSCDYPICNASLFVSAYAMLYPNGRRIFPEIYYSAWGRCNDGAVFQAHPGKFRFVDVGHQRRIVYDYVYGTAHFKDGRFGYWTDYGFHARNPEAETMDVFVRAWGDTVRNPPRRPVKAAFSMVDFDAFRRHGDYLETDCNFSITDGPVKYGNAGDVCNLAEESIAYLHQKIALSGRVTPTVSTLKDLDAITPESCEFVVLPPVVAGTPQETLAAIRRLHARGIGLLATEAVVGLEDLFGVKPSAPRKLTALGDETFAHKKAVANYAADGAKVLLAGNDGIPVVLLNETKTGRTAFVNVPPTAVNRATMRGRYTRGQPSVSDALETAVRAAFAYLEPRPQVVAERGEVCAAYSDDGRIVVTIGDPCPIYHNGAHYPLSFRFTVRAKGVGDAKIETKAPYSVVSRTDDELVLRTETARDDALFFAFAPAAR